MDPAKEKLMGAESEIEELEFGELAAQLAFAGPIHAPRPELKQRVMAVTDGIPTSQLQILRKVETPWVPTSFDGVSYRHLFTDTETKMRTLILRLDPGAIYPRHRHARPEQCLVLSGSVEIDSRIVLEAGDFEMIAAGTTHDLVRSSTGCELLIIASVEDEVLA